MERKVVKAYLLFALTVVCLQLASGRYVNAPNKAESRAKRTVTGSTVSISNITNNDRKSKTTVGTQTSNDRKSKTTVGTQTSNDSKSKTTLATQTSTDGGAYFPDINTAGLLSQNPGQDSVLVLNKTQGDDQVGATENITFGTQTSNDSKSKTTLATQTSTDGGAFFPDINTAGLLSQNPGQDSVLVLNKTQGGDQVGATENITFGTQTSNDSKSKTTLGTQTSTDGGAYFPDINTAGLLSQNPWQDSALVLNKTQGGDEVGATENITVVTTTSSTKPPLNGPSGEAFFPNINQQSSSTNNITDPLSVIKQPPSIEKTCDDGLVFDKGICRKMPKL